MDVAASDGGSHPIVGELRELFSVDAPKERLLEMEGHEGGLEAIQIMCFTSATVMFICVWQSQNSFDTVVSVISRLSVLIVTRIPRS